jgi:hypothetical protein
VSIASRAAIGIALLGSLLTTGIVPAALSAQWTATISVQETAGIRRTSYPANVSFSIPQDRLLPTTQNVRLYEGESSVPVQATARVRWPVEGSVRRLELDFNVSLAPYEVKTLELRYGPDVLPDTAEVRGLSVVEDDTSIQSGRVRFGKPGSALFQSIAYRDELIGAGRNGIAITGRNGITYGASDVEWAAPQILKPGPLVVQIRYDGRLDMGTAVVPVVVSVEMPSSKSWVETRLTVDDDGSVVRDIAIETPLALGPHPWSWDWGTANGTYGAFRDANASMVLTERIEGDREGSWQILTGPRGEERPYESSDVGGYDVVQRWGHLVGQGEAVAFAITGINPPGTVTVALDGSGQTTFRFGQDSADLNGFIANFHSLTLYQHYVSTPVSIGAATSPASILAPLRVSVEP